MHKTTGKKENLQIVSRHAHMQARGQRVRRNQTGLIGVTDMKKLKIKKNANRRIRTRSATFCLLNFFTRMRFGANFGLRTKILKKDSLPLRPGVSTRPAYSYM